MTINMTGVLVLIASPGDALEERGAVAEALTDWNITRGRRERVALLPWLWEKHAVARVGDRPQAIINRQAVDQADVVVAFFDSRLGTSTGVDVSGTAEEINRAVELGKPVHVYFSEEDLPRDVEVKQLEALRKFKSSIQKNSILGAFVDPADLVGQVVRAIEADIDEAGWGGALARPEAVAGARLSWQHRHEREPRGTDKNGRMKYSTTANDLIVTNTGEVAATDLTFEVTGVGQTQFIFPDPPTEPVTLHPDSSMSWTLIPSPSWGASGSTIQVAAAWTEDGQPKTATRTVSLQ